MDFKIGKKLWAIGEGYIPGWSNGKEPQLTSHEVVCILNGGNAEALIRIFIYFADRESVGPYKFEVPAKRTKHIRFNNLTDPQKVPRETAFSSILKSNVPVVVQHTRLDSRQSENALLSTIAYSE